MPTKPPTKRPTKRPAKRPTDSGPPWLWIGLAGVVVLALVVAVVASRGSGSDSAGIPDSYRQNRDVQVSGQALPDFPEGGADPAVGQAAPELRGRSFDGSPVNITTDGKGKLVLFVAHWCPHCQREIPLLKEWLDSHDLPAGVELLTVSTAVTSARPNFPPSTWLEDEGWDAPVLADSQNGSAAATFALPGFPYLVSIDKDGKVVERITGEFPTSKFESMAKAVAG